MINLQTRLELEISAQQWVNSVMSQYDIAAADMEDALTKVLLNLKQQVLRDYLTEQQENYIKARESSGAPQMPNNNNFEEEN